MNTTIIDYFLGLRRHIGWVGLLLPALITLRAGEFLPSLSAAYYSPARDVFVGGMTVIAAFLTYYPGYTKGDRRASWIAGLSAGGVGVFPMAPPNPDTWDTRIGYAHFGCALLFFAALAYLCIYQFTRSGGFMTEAKMRRNSVYRACGRFIVAGVALLAIVATVFEGSPLVFWIESLMVLAFGYAYLIKGEFWMADEEQA